MKTGSSYRKIARNALTGKWWPSVGINFLFIIILFGISIAASFVANFSSVIFQLLGVIPGTIMSALSDKSSDIPVLINSVLHAINSYIIGTLIGRLSYYVIFAITAPFTLGLIAYFINLIRGKEAKIDNLFEGLKRFPEATSTYILVGIFSLLWNITLMLLVGIFVVPLVIGTMMGSLGLIIFGLILAIVAIIGISFWLFCILTRYAFVYYLINDSHKSTPMNIIKQSEQLMKGRSVKFVLLNLSFIGWSILSFLACNIGFLFLLPYISATYAAFYEDCLQDAIANNKITYIELLDGIAPVKAENDNGVPSSYNDNKNDFPSL